MKKIITTILFATCAGCYEGAAPSDTDAGTDPAIDCERFCDADSACAQYVDPAAGYADCLIACDGYTADAAGDPERTADLGCLDACTSAGAAADCDSAADCIDACRPWFWFQTCAAHCQIAAFCDAAVNTDECQSACGDLAADTQACLFGCDQDYGGVTDECGDLAACAAACG